MTPPPAASPLMLATRQWHELVPHGRDADAPPPPRERPPLPTWPAAVLAFDTETTTDRQQRLLFGWYRYARWQPDGDLATVEEGILYADDLPVRDPVGFATLQAFVRTHPADTASGRRRTVQLRSRRAFLNEVFWPAIQADALIVGFNLPFDLSRLAVAWGETRRGRQRTKRGTPTHDVFVRGFSLTLWEYQDRQTGEWRENAYRPRVRIKHVDNKRAFIGLGPVRKRDRRDPHHPGRFL
ncbi:MAG: hypothetical protein M3R02_17775, partial [Chloroflexota bacterium]|nr:hypothetical protein [Chloroflexota bacterium]